MTMAKKQLTRQQAWQKIKHYCAYQERSHFEVKEKLFGMGLFANEVNLLLADLIAENFLNEERFAIQFAGSKFRMKQWGNLKIVYELKQKKISKYCIQKALEAIPPNDYLKTTEKLAMLKWKALTAEKNIFVKRQKTVNYLLHKGYEIDLIRKIVEEL
jgi:regulatory protein